MKRFINTLQNIWKVEELRKRIILTLGLILVYRIGSFIVLPGIDPGKLESSTTGLGAILALFTGGAFSRASILALGIMPYISASIIMQLLGFAIPQIQKMQQDGESGRKKINNYTRLLTIVICAFQAPSYISLTVPPQALVDATPFWWVSTVSLLIAGTMFVMWIGEKITDRGIGNGISLLITVGILAGLPQAFFQEVSLKTEDGNIFLIIVEMVVFLVVILVTVLLVQGVRRIPVQYAKRVVGARNNIAEQGVRDYIPLKVNSSGVMPIIFAQAIMSIPLFAANYFQSTAFASMTDIQGFWYNFVFAVVIIVFTYFYTAIMINPKQMADDMKRNGGFIPGVKPGSHTAEFIDSVLSKITLPGALFLGIIAILPAFAMQAGVTQGFAMFFGGTSLLIMVGVVLDTLQQIESYLLSRHYDGLMEGGKIKGRRSEISGGGMV
ncbi:MAG: preprotein translocase subunit SecY [Crocinitomicaceae bacterium]